MINILIFSKNRACQLELLIRSIKQNLPHFNLGQIYVLYTYTSEDFKKGYDKIFNKFATINPILQSDFESDTRTLLNLFKEYVLFFADDNVIYQHSNLTPKIIHEHFINHNLYCFSLRLGTNTIIQNPYSVNSFVDFPLKFERNVYDKDIFVLTWNWKLCYRFNNFGYPFAMDGHIYKTSDVIKELKFNFNNTTELEGRYCHLVECFSENMSCLEYSVCFNNPVNRISNSGLPSGLQFGFTLEILNDMFLSNQTINLKNLMSQQIIGCHQEVPLDFCDDSV